MPFGGGGLVTVHTEANSTDLSTVRTIPALRLSSSRDSVVQKASTTGGRFPLSLLGLGGEVGGLNVQKCFYEKILSTFRLVFCHILFVY